MSPELEKFLACENCGSANMLMCMDCYQDIIACQCSKSFSVLSLWCDSCSSLFERNLDEFDSDDISDVLEAELLEEVETYKDNYVFGNTDLDPESDVDAILQELMEEADNPKQITAPASPSKPTLQNGSYYEDWDDWGYGYGVYSGTATTTAGTKTGTKTTPTYQKCRHYAPESKIVLAEGIEIYPSSMSNKRSEEDLKAFTPDFGLYADYGWRPAWRNEYVVFPDFGIPTYTDLAIEQINAAIVRAADLNQKVEIGCIGGHGRTGTMLACMKIWASHRVGEPMEPKDAIDWVHKNYCSHAIEGDQQEWWIQLYSHKVFNVPAKLEPMPEKTSSSYSSSCSVKSHMEMLAAGADKCLAAVSCKYWSMDTKNESNWNQHKDKLDKNRIANWKKVVEELKAKPNVPLATARANVKVSSTGDILSLSKNKGKTTDKKGKPVTKQQKASKNKNKTSLQKVLDAFNKEEN